MLEYNQVLLPMKKNRVELRSGFSFTLTNDCLFFGWQIICMYIYG